MHALSLIQAPDLTESQPVAVRVGRVLTRASGCIESPMVVSLSMMLRQLRGHVWTIAPTVASLVRLPVLPPEQPWHTEVDDPDTGLLTLTGRFHERAGADAAVIIVHGLAGSPDSYYMRKAAGEGWRLGCSVLSLALRGADRLGEDLYHGGLTADLHAALASSQLAAYRRIVVLGYSMGGHVALRFAAETSDPRLVAVAAICSPVDLALTQEHMDGPSTMLYRRFLLARLCSMYQVVWARRGGPVSIEQARQIRSFLAWDSLITAPRFGFRNAHDYYRRASAVSVLDDLQVPALLVLERRDPMVPERTLRPHIDQPRRNLEVRWLDHGGHVSFPTRPFALGRTRERGALESVEAQAITWLMSHR